MAEQNYWNAQNLWPIFLDHYTRCDFHDLRRTFATTAEHLDVGSYKLKRLMNHSTGRGDVTAGYIILTAETLRQSAEKIQNYFSQRMTSPNVVDITAALA